MQWKEWTDEYGTCFNSGPYTITQREMERWRLEGPNYLVEERSDVDLLKMIADDHATRSARTSAVVGVLDPPKRVEVDLSEWQLDINEMRRIVQRMSKIVHHVNPYTNRTVGQSRDPLAEIALDLQRVIDRLP